MSQFQVLICKCGAVYAACRVPECYETDDKEWKKSQRMALKRGHSITYKEAGEINLSKCTCGTEQPKAQGTLFDDPKPKHARILGSVQI